MEVGSELDINTGCGLDCGVDDLLTGGDRSLDFTGGAAHEFHREHEGKERQTDGRRES